MKTPDEFGHLRVAKETIHEDYDVRIHYDYGPCWFLLPTDQARELALKILDHLDNGTELPLDERHLEDL